jgi:hydrogenase maturation protease
MAEALEILVATCGNGMASDDNFGVAVAKALGLAGLADVHVIDVGANPPSLLERLAGRHALVIVDAAWAPNAAAGELLECEWDSPHRPTLARQEQLSMHGLSLGAQIEMARSRGLLPPVVRLIAATVERGQIASAMGERQRRQVDPAVQCIRRLREELLGRMRQKSVS